MEETTASYGTTSTLKIILKDAEGNSSTISLYDPKSDAALTQAITDFNEVLFDSDTNIFAVKGAQPISATYEIVTTTRTKIGEYSGE